MPMSWSHVVTDADGDPSCILGMMTINNFCINLKVNSKPYMRSEIVSRLTSTIQWKQSVSFRLGKDWINHSCVLIFSCMFIIQKKNGPNAITNVMTNHNAHNMIVCECVCVCTCVRAGVCACVRACVGACVCVFIYIYLYVYIHLSVCLSVCLSVYLSIFLSIMY